ncbi:MAG: RES family NAD+ phosphorylase [Sedimentisphaerales bacterium]|nr:RES family NAD+ phosphorylase [Sedimentisphaerales bacterium]
MMERYPPSDKALEYIEKIQPEMAYCSTCQPYDEGDVVWIFGIRTDLEDILDDYDVPEELRDEVADNLHCNGCGCQLGRYDDIGLKTEEELRSDQRWMDWYENYEYKIDEFRDFLEKYPYLGLSHEIGRKICDAMPNFPIITIDNEVWYRARRPDKGRRMNVEDMYPPDFPEAEGRFSHYGQRVFYLASTKEAAAIETIKKDECLAWVQEFRIKKATNILNLVNYMYEEKEMPVLALGLIHSKLRYIVPTDSPWKPEYFIPRFIADCARIHTLNGIVFESAKHYEKNLVLFNIDPTIIEPVGEPRALELKGKVRGPLNEDRF